jgi:hypothetical protein
VLFIYSNLTFVSIHDQGSGLGGMQTQLSSVEISKKFEVTSKTQNTASSFCKVKPSGFGFLPTRIRFDPTYYEK